MEQVTSPKTLTFPEVLKELNEGTQILVKQTVLIRGTRPGTRTFICNSVQKLKQFSGLPDLSSLQELKYSRI